MNLHATPPPKSTIPDLQVPPVNRELMKQITVDRSLNKLSTEALTVQISHAELPLASFHLVLSFYGESLGGRGFVAVWTLDSAHGELPSDTRTLISRWEIFCGKLEVWNC
jgi:hypothetical protein